MRFILTAIFGAIAYAFYPGNISAIPLAQLTLKDIGGLFGTFIFSIMAVRALFEEDK